MVSETDAETAADAADEEPAYVRERRERFTRLCDAGEGDVLSFETGGEELDVEVMDVQHTACEKYLHCEDVHGVPFTVELDPRHHSVDVSVRFMDAGVNKYV